MAWYLDILLDRREGGTEVSGPHRWLVDANWKTAAENFGGDGYHIASYPWLRAGARYRYHDRAKLDTGIRAARFPAATATFWFPGSRPPDDAGPWFAQPDEIWSTT